DQWVIVVNKPAGMVVHPACGNHTGTLVNALLYHCKTLSGIGGVIRPGIVHRLDKGTTGVLVVAKNDLAHHSLSEQFKNHTVVKKYSALVFGSMEEASGTIRTPIGRHYSDRKKMSTQTRKGRDAVTHWYVKEAFDQLALLAVTIETGRTHQVRVHLSDIGHPLAGDELYGALKKIGSLHVKNVLDALKGLDRPLLHAGHLEFIHPMD
ncbi:MAG: RluA family pseudouridine synthase, partial [Pseudomonadota bacterium]